MSSYRFPMKSRAAPVRKDEMTDGMSASGALADAQSDVDRLTAELDAAAAAIDAEIRARFVVIARQITALYNANPALRYARPSDFTSDLMNFYYDPINS